MKKLKVKKPLDHYMLYSGDIERIVKIFAKRGYEISDSDAAIAWEMHSDCFFSSWMCLGTDDEVFDDAFYYFEEVESGC